MEALNAVSKVSENPLDEGWVIIPARRGFVYCFKEKKPSISQGLETGAGEEGRTPDLMLGKHTL